MSTTLAIDDAAKLCVTCERQWHDAAHEVATWARTVDEGAGSDFARRGLRIALIKYAAAWTVLQDALNALPERRL